MRSTPRDSDPPPVAPTTPAPEDCCHSGCDPCVYQLYDEALERYEAALRTWQERQQRRQQERQQQGSKHGPPRSGED
jgi:hypothetical protein